LQHYIANHPDVELTLAAASYEPQGYGFVVAPKLNVVRQLDVALLAAREDGQVDRIVESWLDSPSD
jgi:ABC-type amino acid transport substrate-binding protein